MTGVQTCALPISRHLAGLKGYVTNIHATTVDAQEVINSHHELWHVEQSLRMSKHDLAGWPAAKHERAGFAPVAARTGGPRMARARWGGAGSASTGR